jgi:hypothetical protein
LGVFPESGPCAADIHIRCRVSLPRGMRYGVRDGMRDGMRYGMRDGMR